MQRVERAEARSLVSIEKMPHVGKIRIKISHRSRDFGGKGFQRSEVGKVRGQGRARLRSDNLRDRDVEKVAQIVPVLIAENAVVEDRNDAIGEGAIGGVFAKFSKDRAADDDAGASSTATHTLARQSLSPFLSSLSNRLRLFDVSDVFQIKRHASPSQIRRLPFYQRNPSRSISLVSSMRMAHLHIASQRCGPAAGAARHQPPWGD